MGIFQTTEKKATRSDFFNMPPIHLIMWGDPDKEPYDEVAEIFATWGMSNINPNTRIVNVTDINPATLHKAIKSSVDDDEAQIIYLSCHGAMQGLAFSSSAQPTITHSTLSEWLQGMTPPGDRWLVFGFCYSMNPAIEIEKYMPNWVVRVAGFIDTPRAPEVAQLMAGITANLHDWVHEVIAKTGELLDENISTTDDPWRATENAFNAAVDMTTDDPARNNLPDDRTNIIVATRNPNTYKWVRQAGTDFLKPK